MGRETKVLSHWHVLVDNFNTSALGFYERVETAIRVREVPEVTFSRNDFMEGGIASAKRQYLRVERRFIAFDICAAPYGRGYFFSYWLARLGPEHPVLYLLGFLMLLGIISLIVNAILGDAATFFAWIFILPLILYGLGYLVRERVISSEEEVLMVPIVGWIYARLFNPVTYYSLDTAIMFREAIHAAVLEAIDDLTTSTGMRALTDGEKKPVMSELLDSTPRR